MRRPVSAGDMSEIDRRAQDEYGIPSHDLMEVAGKTVADAVMSAFDLDGKRVAILCGRGNNGGDGFVAARYIAGKYPEVPLIFLVSDMSACRGDAKTNYDLALKMGIPTCFIDELMSSATFSKDIAVIVDAIFGTGFHGDLPAPLKKLGESLNESKIPCYAVDVPTGLDATTGVASAGCLRAVETITFGLPKTGFFQADGPLVCGKVNVKNIGFPEALLSEYSSPQNGS